MRRSKGLVGMTFLVFVAGACFAQVKSRNSHELLTRISYRSTYGVDWREQKSSPQICFALYRDGHYRLSRMTESGTRGFQGTLSDNMLSRLSEILKKLDAQRREDGIIWQGSESVMVETAGKADRYAWVDADHRRPFPESVLDLVHWLQGFKAQDAAPLNLRDLSDQPICPPASEKPLHPTVAALSGAADASATCGGSGSR